MDSNGAEALHHVNTRTLPEVFLHEVKPLYTDQISSLTRRLNIGITHLDRRASWWRQACCALRTQDTKYYVVNLGSTRLEGTRANRHVWFVDTVNVANVRIAM